MKPRKWQVGPLEDGPEGGQYRDVYDGNEVVATVPQDYREDTRNLNIILEAPEAVKACLYMMRVMKDYRPSTSMISSRITRIGIRPSGSLRW
jgi:hypothetical protein